MKGYHTMTKLISTSHRRKARSFLLMALTALVLIPATGHARDRDDDRNYDRNRGNNNSHYHGHGNWNGNNGRGHSYYKPNYNPHQWNNYNNRYTYTRVNLSSRDESRVRRDLQRYYFDKCGGVYWRNSHGCQPVGARYGYRIGEPLSPHAVVWSLPSSVYYNLPPPQYGTRYAWVDRDLLLISEGRGTILDILLRL